MKKSTVQAAQAVLILIARIAWAMYDKFSKNFSSFNPKYTPQFGKDALADVDKAAAFPSNEEIAGVVTGYLNKLKAAGLNCTNLWQVLSKYIEDTFDAADWAAAKREAGFAFYAKAAKPNWASLSKLLEAATAFMVKYKDTLTQPGKGMPADFPDTFAEAKTKYDNALQEFTVARQDAKLQTAERYTLYKSVQTVLIAMLKDAQRIFRFDAANKKAFTFAAIKRNVAPETSGIHISIKEAVSLLPVTTARILFQPGSLTADTNQKGIAVRKLKPGTYSATITIPGYDTIIVSSLKITDGRVSRLHLQAHKQVAVAS